MNLKVIDCNNETYAKLFIHNIWFRVYFWLTDPLRVAANAEELKIGASSVWIPFLCPLQGCSWYSYTKSCPVPSWFQYYHCITELYSYICQIRGIPATSQTIRDVDGTKMLTLVSSRQIYKYRPVSCNTCKCFYRSFPQYSMGFWRNSKLLKSKYIYPNCPNVSNNSNPFHQSYFLKNKFNPTVPYKLHFSP